MSNPLEKYFSERYKPSGDLQKDPGPVVTISREFGCPAKIISHDQSMHPLAGLAGLTAWLRREADAVDSVRGLCSGCVFQIKLPIEIQQGLCPCFSNGAG